MRIAVKVVHLCTSRKRANNLTIVRPFRRDASKFVVLGSSTLICKYAQRPGYTSITNFGVFHFQPHELISMGLVIFISLRRALRKLVVEL